MIYIGLGANLSSVVHGPPAQTLAAALRWLEVLGVHILGRSSWYRSRPVPDSGQPWFVNGVAAIATGLPPAALLALLHRVEAEFGRVRGERWAARCIDLDILDYDGLVTGGGGGGPVLPHPRLTERGFVLLPLAELEPGWRDPVAGTGIGELIAALPPDQPVEPLHEAP